MSEFPNDADGDVLRQLKANDFDFSRPYDVDFYCYAKTKEAALSICQAAEKMGYKPEIFVDDEAENPEQKHSVYMSVNILVSYQEVTKRQNNLNQLLSEFDTICDGWGVLH